VSARSAPITGIATRAATASVTAVLREFAYDDANRMREVKQDGVVAMRYLYNGKGEQVYKTGSGKTISTVYDEAGHWIGDYDANGQPVQQAIWLDDLPVGLLVGAGVNQKLYYIEADALGTPRVVIDPDRNVAVWKWDLANEAFGDSAPNEDADADGIAFVLDMRMAGQRYDAASGLSQNGYRDYSASDGRYVQSDPIGLGGGVSTYGYVGGNPLIGVDPFGLEILGIHSSAFNNDPSPASGHGWLGIYADNGTLLETWGSWQGSHKLTRNAPNGCECKDSNVYRDIEKNNSKAYTPQESIYIYMTPQEFASLRQFIAQPWEFGTYRSNCASWVDTAVEHVFPYLTMNVTDFRALGATTPRALSGNLHEWRQQFPNNSVRNPLNQPQGWKPPK
jgi:RHS repeat-associated protein